MAFEGVPNETRKSFPDGTTIFERVLPGADRMYPDTDSAPIPLGDEYLDNLKKNLPKDIHQCYEQLIQWGIPEDTYTYLFSKNLYPVMEKLIELGVPSRFAGTFLGHTLKNLEGRSKGNDSFNYFKIVKLFAFLKNEGIHYQIAWYILPQLYKNPKLDIESILSGIKFKKRDPDEIKSSVQIMRDKFYQIRVNNKKDGCRHWVMGQLRSLAIGNMPLEELSNQIN